MYPPTATHSGIIPDFHQHGERPCTYYSLLSPSLEENTGGGEGVKIWNGSEQDSIPEMFFHSCPSIRREYLLVDLSITITITIINFTSNIQVRQKIHTSMEGEKEFWRTEATGENWMSDFLNQYNISITTSFTLLCFVLCPQNEHVLKPSRSP